MGMADLHADEAFQLSAMVTRRFKLALELRGVFVPSLGPLPNNLLVRHHAGSITTSLIVDDGGLVFNDLTPPRLGLFGGVELLPRDDTAGIVTALELVALPMAPSRLPDWASALLSVRRRPSARWVSSGN
jgi:hypothetical protein